MSSWSDYNRRQSGSTGNRKQPSKGHASGDISGPGKSIDRTKLDSDGNLRPAKRSAASNYMASEKYICGIRDTLKDAYESFILRNTTEQIFNARTVNEEINFYLLKLIGSLSTLQSQNKEKTTKNDDANEINTDEVVIIKERIKKLFDSIPNGKSEQKYSVRNESVSAVNMLDFIELTVHDYKEEIMRCETDITQLCNRATTLLKDVSTMITQEPLNFTWSKQTGSPKLVHGLTAPFQQVVIDINGIKKCLEENFESFEMKFVSVMSLSEINECKNHMQMEITELKQGNEELLNRLSKLAGANLTDNNPTISDLSDPNRAAKLAEQFSELYDTPWTDAFDALHRKTKDEMSCIGKLLNIIIKSYEMCEEISVMQQDVLTIALYRPSEGLASEEKIIKVIHDKDVRLSKIQSRTLSELRKQTAILSTEDVKKYILAKNEDWFDNPELERFSVSCIQLGWYMHLQSPPVYLDAALVRDAKFDTDKYRSYTKAGNKVDYLVWPSLLLYRGGPILYKGIAQGK